MASANKSSEVEGVSSGFYEDLLISLPNIDPVVQYPDGERSQRIELAMAPTTKLGPNFWTHQLEASYPNVGFESKSSDFGVYAQPNIKFDEHASIQTNASLSFGTNSYLSSQDSISTQGWLTRLPRNIGIDLCGGIDVKNEPGATNDFDPDFNIDWLDDSQQFNIELGDQPSELPRSNSSAVNLAAFGYVNDVDLSYNATSPPMILEGYRASDFETSAITRRPAMTGNSVDSKVKIHQCNICLKVFGRSGDLGRHYREHFEENRCYHCYEDGCDRNGQRGFFRRDKLRDHQKSVHGGIGEVKF